MRRQDWGMTFIGRAYVVLGPLPNITYSRLGRWMTHLATSWFDVRRMKSRGSFSSFTWALVLHFNSSGIQHFVIVEMNWVGAT